MANTTSDIMATRFTNPATMNSVTQDHARKRSKRILVTVAGTEANNHIFVLARFRAEDRILGIKLVTDDLGTTLTVDIGLHEAGDWSLADQTVVDTDIYVDGQVLNTAIATLTEVLGFGNVDPENIGQLVWEDAGLSEAPVAGTEYDMTMEIVATGTPAAGSVVLIVEYAAGD